MPPIKKGISFKDPTPIKLVSEVRRLKAEEMMKKRIDMVQKDVLVKEQERQVTKHIQLQPKSIPIVSGSTSASKNAYINIFDETERQRVSQSTK